MTLHQPQFDDAPLPHPLFLTPKVKGFNVTKHVWFMNTHMWVGTPLGN